MDSGKPMDPQDQAFWEMHLRQDDEAEAKAGLLEELIDLVLPEARLVTRPIRERDGGHGDPPRVAELERLFGSLPARARALAVLDEPAVLLAGGYAPDMEMIRHVSAQDTGFIEGERLHLLMDGRLVLVRLAGVWFIEERTLRTASVVVDVREVSRGVAADRFSFQSILSALRSHLYWDFKFLEGKHVPDLAERRSRFNALVADYGRAVAEFTDRLRRVGDTPP